MTGNDFDTDVMPSARAARTAERRMLIGLPAFVAIVVAVALCTLAAVHLGTTAR